MNDRRNLAVSRFHPGRRGWFLHRVPQEQNSSQPTISRQVAALEEHLGARLFTRTTRKLTSSAILFARQNLEQRFAIDPKLNPRRG